MDPRVQEQRLGNLEQQVKKMAAAALEHEQAAHKAEALDVLTNVMSSAFDKMSTYTSLIVIGGYAAFFSVWGAVEKFVAPWIRLWAFGCVGLSALLFVLSEAYRIAKFSGSLQKQMSVLQNASPSQFKAAYAEMMKRHNSQIVAGAKAQRVMFLLVTGLAVVGALILFYGIGSALLNKAS